MFFSKILQHFAFPNPKDEKEAAEEEPKEEAKEELVFSLRGGGGVTTKHEAKPCEAVWGRGEGKHRSQQFTLAWRPFWQTGALHAGAVRVKRASS